VRSPVSNEWTLLTCPYCSALTLRSKICGGLRARALGLNVEQAARVLAFGVALHGVEAPVMLSAALAIAVTMVIVGTIVMMVITVTMMIAVTMAIVVTMVPRRRRPRRTMWRRRPRRTPRRRRP